MGDVQEFPVIIKLEVTTSATPQGHMSAGAIVDAVYAEMIEEEEPFEKVEHDMRNTTLCGNTEIREVLVTLKRRLARGVSDRNLEDTALFIRVGVERRLNAGACVRYQILLDTRSSGSRLSTS